MKIVSKYIIAFFVSITLSNHTIAQENFCELQELTAKIIMKARQGGVSMSDTMEILKINGSDTEANMLMVRLAYIEPRYNTPSFQQDAIDSFRNKVYLVCKRNTEK